MSKKLIPPPNAIHSVAGYTWMDESGIIIAVATPQELHTLEHAQASIAAMAQLAGDRRYPMLVDMSNVRAMSREARTYYAGPEPPKYNSALAMVTSSNFGRMVANFFMSLTTQKVPTRMFGNVADAEEWLMQYVDNK